VSKKVRVRQALITLFIQIVLGFSFLLISNESFALPNSEGIRIYRKDLHLSPEHRQKVADDISSYYQADNLWDVLREEFSLPNYKNIPIVRAKIAWYMNNQPYLIRCALRAAPYLYYIMQQVKKRHLPPELVLLPIIESGYDPFSLSSMGASGIWQLMPNTATSLGVQHDRWYDGRRDILASTKAALNHLAYLQSFFEGNWLLALAAYNTGEGNVLTAIKRNIRNGKSTDFWSLSLAQQTKDYVPSILALAVIISHPEQYPVNFPSVRNAPYLAQIDAGTQLDLKFAAKLAGLSYKKLIQLNPGFNLNSTSTKGPFKLVLPIENVAQFSRNLAGATTGDKKIFLAENKPKSENIFDIAKHLHLNPKKPYKLRSGDTIYMVRTNDTLQTIAKRFHIKLEWLLTANQLKTKNLAPGKQLIIPTSILATNSTEKSALPPDGNLYRVQRNDSIERIAKKFHTTPAEIRILNFMASNTLQEGDRLIIPPHLRG
jgi:membrane-bound lytic murein transglycosylase D